MKENAAQRDVSEVKTINISIQIKCDSIFIAVFIVC